MRKNEGTTDQKQNFVGNKLKTRRVQLSRQLTVFTLMRLRQFANDSRLILPINPDKAPKADDSRLILPINPDNAHKVSLIIYIALYTINNR